MIKSYVSHHTEGKKTTFESNESMIHSCFIADIR